MKKVESIYRQRFIPKECILLKDDVIVEQSEDFILTQWKTINPKSFFDHGSSCYCLKDGVKISKMYRSDGSLYLWYCDIVDYVFDEEAGALTVIDLLADVTIRPDGKVQVCDLDELAEALEHGLITEEQMCKSLRNLHNLLSLIYRDKFERLQAPLNSRGL